MYFNDRSDRLVFWTGIEQDEASPHYNASILEDMGIQAHSSYLLAAITQRNMLRDAILLLKVYRIVLAFLHVFILCSTCFHGSYFFAIGLDATERIYRYAR